MRSRLFLGYWLVIGGVLTAILLVGGTLEIYLAYGENLKRIEAVQQAEVRLVSGRIAQALAAIERAARDTASIPWDARLFTLEDARQEFHRLFKVVAPIYELRARDRDGRLVLSVSRVETDMVAAAGTEDAGTGRAPDAGYQPVRYRKGSEPFATLVLPLEGRSRLFGSIEADLNLKFVSEVIRDASSAPSRNVFVIDASDKLVAHTDSSLPLRGGVSFHELPHVRAMRSLAAADGPVSSRRSADISGNAVVASGTAIGGSGWLAFVEEPRELLAQDAWRTARRTALMILAGLLASVIASFLLARRLSRPVLELRRGAERISKGDLTARIEVERKDEVGELATAFNRMAAQLEDYTGGLERKVEEKTASLQDAMRARSLFLAAASHDLRQPLYAISILADAVAAQELPAVTAAAIEKQRGAIGVLKGLFDNLLDLSRLEAGEIKPARRVVSIREVLAPLESQFQSVAQAKGLQWRGEVADEWVETDPELVRRVTSNLLSNAVRYTNEGEVSLRVVTEGATVRVEVSDTGIGIPEAEQPRVFDEFVQLDNSERDREKGVGLGLSIVRRIDQLLGLQMALESKPGKGTRITFNLPAAAGVAPAAGLPAPAAGVEELGGKRLWVVEDDRLVREALAIQLDAWNVDHAFATTREEILRLRDQDGAWPDAVMLDDMLGRGEHGLELALWLKDHLSADRIAMATGNVNAARLAQLQASGLRVLRKPLSSAELAAWLHAATGRAAGTAGQAGG